MKLVNIRKARSGDVLSYSIFTEKGQIMVKEGKTLTADIINRIRKLGINYIYIKNEFIDDIEPINPEFVRLKGEVVKSLNSMYNRIQSEDLQKIDDVNKNVKSLVEFIVTSSDINTAYLSDLKTFDNYTYIHSLNTALTALFLGKSMGLATVSLEELTLGALLHDIGKIKVSKQILNKSGKLTEEEFDIMKKHPKYGHDMIFKMPSVSPASRLISLQHHEKVNKKGYPYGLASNEIELYSKIVAVSDVYDAISNNRVYRNAMETDKAYDIIIKSAGTHFDSNVVEVFEREMFIYPLGIQVEVTGGMAGYVVKQNKERKHNPVVRLTHNPDGEKMNHPIEIDLDVLKDVKIKKVIV